MIYTIKNNRERNSMLWFELEPFFTCPLPLQPLREERDPVPTRATKAVEDDPAVRTVCCFDMTEEVGKWMYITTGRVCGT